MQREPRGARILITGASSGIGQALAERAAREGARVAIAARSHDSLTQIAGRLNAEGAEVLPVAADVTNESDRQNLMDAVVARFGGLDVLINNAGIAASGHFIDCSEGILRQIMEVNFFAAAEMVRLAVPVLAQGKMPAIVNVSSMCGRRGMPAWPEYSASKFALVGLTEAIRAELKSRFEIDVLLILPGLTATRLDRNLLKKAAKQKLDFSAAMQPEKVASVILTSLRCNRRETIIGSEARWILGFNRWVPGFVDRMLTRRVRQLWRAADQVPVEV